MRRRHATAVLCVVGAAAIAALASVTSVSSTAAISASTGQAAPSQFQAIDLPLGPSWWLDASVPETLFSDSACSAAATSGGAVRCWQDRLNPANAVTGSTAMVWSTASYNGLHPVQFTGTTNLAGPDVFGGTTSDMEIFVVSVEITTKANFLVSLHGSATGNIRFSLHAPWSDGRIYFDAGNHSTNRAFASPRQSPVGQITLYDGWKSLADSKTYLVVSDSATTRQSSTLDPAPTTGGLQLGGMVGYATDNYIAELIAYDYSLSAADRAKVTAYLMSKWGIPAIP